METNKKDVKKEINNEMTHKPDVEAVATSEQKIVQTETVSSKEVVAQSDQTEQKSMKPVLAFIAGIAVAFVAHALFTGSFFDGSDTVYKSGEVVAKVNGEKIYGKALDQQIEQFAVIRGYEGSDTLADEERVEIESQALDALINTELIVQAAEHANLNITDEEIQSQYNQLVESIGGAEVAYDRFEDLGTTPEEFKENLEGELLIAKYMEEIVFESELSVTDEEIQTFYDTAVATVENAPTLDEVVDIIKEQIVAQKQQDALVELLQELRAGALIEEMI